MGEMRAVSAEATVEPTGELPVEALNEVEVDFLILADRAETQNGKLYLMGGGWDRLLIPPAEEAVSFSIALGVLVPWNATNRQHRLRVTIEDFDGRPIDFTLEAGFTTGRGPTMFPGEVQRVMVAIPSITQRFPAPGKYTLAAQINGVVKKRVEFYAVRQPTKP
jgi:hypothetical protein